MTDIVANNKRIAKNTFVLYLRTFFVLCVGLFTGRVVLNTLGVEDYGIYNVVGGFISLLALFNGAMSTATQRFISFELVRGNLQRQKTTFSTAIIIHFALAFIVVVLAETIGLWFVYNKLTIPESRMNAALWVYQLSVVSMFISMVTIPYNALIVAYEKMSAFAYISILNTVLKLVIVYLIAIAPWDKLIFYAVLLFIVGLIDRAIYQAYCNRHFKESKFIWVFDRPLFKEMCNIAGWSMLGNAAGVFCTQGLNVLLNMFFTPVVNAARGIAVTVQGAVSGFIGNFQTAINPQIIKSYAADDLKRMHSLVFASSKFSFYMLFLIVLPIIVEAKEILYIWLGIVPEHTVWFLRLTLIIMLFDTLANPLWVSSQAVGRVRLYQSVVGGLLLLILPVAYVALKLGGTPESVYYVHLLIVIIANVFRTVIVSRMIQMSILTYMRRVIIPITIVALVAGIPAVILYYTIPHFLWSDFAIIISILIIDLTVSFALGLSKSERKMVIDKAIVLKKKILHR